MHCKISSIHVGMENTVLRHRHNLHTLCVILIYVTTLYFDDHVTTKHYNKVKRKRITPISTTLHTSYSYGESRMDKTCVQLLRGFVLLHMMIGCIVQAKFDFTVHFYEYWNPTGLCGECGTNNTIPACCDDTTLTTNCTNTGDKRCDTRFRFILRPYGASVETAPSTNYKHYTRSVTNENHDTFQQGPGGFLTLPNPHTSQNSTAWTGRIQLHIDALDRAQSGSETTAIIDRFPIDLDLELGVDFTPQVSYIGIYNISQLEMSFSVKCSENYYGPSCIKLCEPVENMFRCDSNGDHICSFANYDITTDCTTCLPGRNLSTNCRECLVGRNLSTNCTTCLSGYVGENCAADTDTAAITKQATSNTSDIVLGVFLVLSVAIIITLIIVIIVIKKPHKRSSHQEDTSTQLQVHDKGHLEATTSQPSGKQMKEVVEETKIDNN